MVMNIYNELKLKAVTLHNYPDFILKHHYTLFRNTILSSIK